MASRKPKSLPKREQRAILLLRCIAFVSSDGDGVYWVDRYWKAHRYSDEWNADTWLEPTDRKIIQNLWDRGLARKHEFKWPTPNSFESHITQEGLAFLAEMEKQGHFVKPSRVVDEEDGDE